MAKQTPENAKQSKEAPMASEQRAVAVRVTQVHHSPSGMFLKIGGTTVGSVAIGAAIGTCFSPAVGTVVGAVIGGTVGAALSTYEAKTNDAD
jgi:outer membrane lipoprotein SlyB